MRDLFALIGAVVALFWFLGALGVGNFSLYYGAGKVYTSERYTLIDRMPWAGSIRQHSLRAE